MNREIKFRVWDIELEDMIYQDKYKWQNFAIAFFNPNDNGKIFMQFVGLRDRKNREIYDKDIIKFTIKGKGKDIKIAEVNWDNKELCYWFGGYVPVEIKDKEVIGNKFENPELINNKQ